MTAENPGRTLLDIALDLVGREFPTHPLHRPTPGAVAFDGSPRECSCNKPACGSVGKHPRTPHGCNDATLDEAQVRKWWGLWPDANIGIATGHALTDGGDLVVVDIDGAQGEESFALACEELFPFPDTFTVRTGSGGRHLYGRARRSVRSRTGVLPGVDVRGVGGYVVAPGSTHASGQHYFIESGTPDQLAWIPDEWLNLLEPAAPDSSGHSAASADEWIQLVTHGVEEGGRNAAVARLAGHLLARGLHGRVALALVEAWNDARNRPPLSAVEVEATVRSIAAREVAKQQGVRR